MQLYIHIRFSYKRPGYEASVKYDYATVRNTAVVQFCGKKYANCWENPGTLLNRFVILLSHNLLSTASNT